MNLANLMTSLRIGLAFAFIFCMIQNTLPWEIAGLIVFIIATLTDYWDGAIARAMNQVSSWGELFDPIADKVLNFGAFFLFSHLGFIPLWMVLLMLIREVFITLFRFWIISASGKVVAAQFLGKLKTVVQMVCIYCFIFEVIFDLSYAIKWVFVFNALLNWSALIITLYSGFIILKDSCKALSTKK